VKGPIILLFLVVINLMTSPGHWWVQWPALGIAIAWTFSLLRVMRALVLAGGLAAVFALLKLIDERGLGNVRILQHDAVEVIAHMLTDDCVDGVHIYFPDPWHKKRHHKRRLIQPPLVELLASRLKPGGRLHCATDWEEYAQQMLEVLGGSPLLQNTADGYAPRPGYRPLTKFEARGQRLGHGVWDLVFTRRG
jgi:tRNA (guanine-N7-)-methyltransferase